VAGKIDGSLDFDGSNDYLNVGNTGLLSLTSTGTLSAWVKFNGTPNQYSYLVGKSNTGNPLGQSYLMALANSPSDQRIRVKISGGANSSDYDMAYTSTNTWTSGTWYYILGEWNGTWLQMYVNGKPDGTADSQERNAWVNTTFNVQIGCGFENGCTSNSPNAVNGTMDEVRISYVARSADWIKTEYNNQNSPSTFYTVGNLVGSPCKPTFIQAASNSSYGNNIVITLPRPSNAGDLIVVSTDVQRNGGSPAVLSKTDTKGNTYSSAALTDWNGTFYRAWTFYATNITGGGPITINITLDSNPASSYTHAAEYSGVAAVTPLDQIRSNTGTGGLTLFSGPRTTTQASELIYGYGVSEGTCSVDAPYIARDTAFGSFIADQTVSSIGSYNVTGSMSYAQQWGCQMLTFIGR
jgi:hypothetical protein